VVGLGPNSVVLDEHNRVLDLEKNVGEIGRLARGGSVPVGYYKDPEKSAATFLEIDGKRYSVPGDFARIEEGNRVTLLGRGSNCVNTGGEKVYPEEVEMAIKRHPAVYDVLVVGIPDEKYGQSVAAVVQVREGATVELDELRDFLREFLSGYKLPRAMTIVPEIPRNATGKAQYPRAKELVLAARTASAAAGAEVSA
jgi:acyl-CoA synthetase (AMP-forming)/AMP-acid ligase II